MIQSSGVIICLAYILGLLFTAVPWGGVWILALGILAAVFFRAIFINLRKINYKQENYLTKAKTGVNTPLTTPHPRVWLIAGLVGLLATFYFQVRTPQPGAKDISQFVSNENNSNQEQLVIVRGDVIGTPRLTRSQRGQFWLNATQLDEVKNDQGPASVPKGVTGKLYVTVPILQATGLYPGQQIAITGMLYKPKGAQNPGAFDFQKYLKQEGTFAGLIGKQINIIDEERKWGWWKIREKIVRSQVRWLGVPEGPLVSAMVLGSKAVDLPYDIRDLFVNVGLAHALAASGFQTSLILGIILQLTSKANKGIQFFCGSLGLLTFLCLAGFQSSILRAVIMGFAALIGLVLERKVQQLGSLLLAATLLLLFNPVWIGDLGFQLSFLATLGLIVTATPITKRFDWLPSAIASLISVPIAATIWTLPLLLHIFSVVAVYSVPLNIITTPLISVISIGGMISGLVSLIVPDLGSTLASFLYYPTYWLIQLAEFFANLPGSSVAVGSISTWQMFVVYGLIISTCLIRWWQKRWWFAGLMVVVLLIIPAWHSTSNLLRITLLATNNEPVLVIQDQGKVTLINSGDEGTGRFTILPFLQQQGINQIDWAISSKFLANENDAWLEIMDRMPIKNFYAYFSQQENNLETQAIQKKLQQQQGIYQPLALGQTISTGAIIAQFTNEKLPILKLQIFGRNWLLVGSIKSQQIAQLVKTGDLSSPQVLWCPSESLQDLVTALQPQVAIASDNNLNSKTLDAIKGKTKLFFTGRDGAIQWTPDADFEAFIQVTENKSSNL
ncbi:ComEC/Rec2 family competence protein [Sphaerospermopsis kisseleviana CS-549]|uniref:ComEC/Rec2 family competence protein n=1 Tax=Sphaerospermopsis kisseleviana CS-549 TaxID=3021783 RepID=A0ABT4ZRA3_9CYAN|nr:ComEC/Rec2 family competence protein [Sphaerospermopsis kisseleviana]MDB9441935.1 ComEC/Rec2 family competence protein [Sphaerospermopsis kisseleviana CS-549]BAZ80466.1 comEC/Rec2-like protein [Sphaerospermopsis kisseleviana NIES-73]